MENEVRLSKLTVHHTKDIGYQWSLQNETHAVIALVALRADADYIARVVNNHEPTEDELDRAGQVGVAQGLHRAATYMLEDAKTAFANNDDAHADLLRMYATRFRAQAEAVDPR